MYKKEENITYVFTFVSIYIWNTLQYVFYCNFKFIFLYTLDKLPLDAVPTLKKMILYAAPTKSLRTIASDSDIALQHVSYFLKLLEQNSALSDEVSRYLCIFFSRSDSTTYYM